MTKKLKILNLIVGEIGKEISITDDPLHTKCEHLACGLTGGAKTIEGCRYSILETRKHKTSPLHTGFREHAGVHAAT